MDRNGFTLIQLLVVVGVIAVVAAIAFPTIAASRRAYNERTASSAMKTLSPAEADFRANDRDWNHVNDYWTADVKSLYTLTSAGQRGNSDAPIRLIELETAAADADPTFIPAGGENRPLSSFAVPAPRSGYWFAAMITDKTLAGTEEADYKRDTGGRPGMGKVHNTSKFGFTALPADSSTGNFVFLINENNTIFRSPPSGLPELLGSPPGLKAIPDSFLEWPEDRPFKQYWNTVD